MPRRLVPLVTDEYYHIFNRSLFRQPILQKQRDIKQFHELVQYYIQDNPPIKYSYFKKNPSKYSLHYDKKLVSIISYCYMPNHFHFCLRQEIDNGIHIFMLKILNSFSHYFSLKYGYKGPLFESSFKAKLIETDTQLIHLSRYHHLNPVIANIVKHPIDYLYSSYQVYKGNFSYIVDTKPVLSHFTSFKDYETFVLDRIDYQKELERIKHLTFT